MSYKWKVLTAIRKALLWVINHWLGGSSSGPIVYGCINGIDALSYSHLVSEDSQQPGITVREVIDGIDRFKSCPIGKGVMVIEGDETREATVWDLHNLRETLTRKPKDGSEEP